MTRAERRYLKDRARARKAETLARMTATLHRDEPIRPVDERDFPWIGRGPRYAKGRVGRNNSPWDSFGFRLKYPTTRNDAIAEQLEAK